MRTDPLTTHFQEGNLMIIKLMVLLGTICLGAQNVILSHLKLSFSVTMLNNIVVVLFASLYCLASTSTLKWPTGTQQWVLLFAAGCLLTVGAVCLTKAYQHGSSASEVTPILALMPVFAALMQWIALKKTPSSNELLAMFFTFCAIWCMFVRK